MLHLTFWGTSDAQGVPRLLCNCSVCKKAQQKNLRNRCSLLVKSSKSNLLIDVSPDFRTQFLKYADGKVPCNVLITHAHNDHIGGLGDLADLCFWQNVNTGITSPPEMIGILRQRYPYLIKRRGIHFIASHISKLDDWNISFHKVNHGFNGYAYGIKFERKGFVWSYIPDIFRATEDQLNPFLLSDLIIIGTSFWKEEADIKKRSIYDVEEVLTLKEKYQIPRMILTHLSHDIDIPKHEKRLPEGVQFAYDGFELTI
ncbi:hydrolase [Kroppenstedtia guangzhouensis]|uniref:Hydrolase n=1 Tax=Kroppenstedtia guangzhouensis TaxID=1274356 RepID=A0ABQ1H480_9BACL|nr:MBL fold metallo-hydrolase [Kroppenstedtia guangzhouensis]GGA58249.1 hydrolase [Kroppenstedtia guangzhouensis]